MHLYTKVRLSIGVCLYEDITSFYEVNIWLLHTLVNEIYNSADSDYNDQFISEILMFSEYIIDLVIYNIRS